MNFFIHIIEKIISKIKARGSSKQMQQQIELSDSKPIEPENFSKKIMYTGQIDKKELRKSCLAIITSHRQLRQLMPDGIPMPFRDLLNILSNFISISEFTQRNYPAIIEETAQFAATLRDMKVILNRFDMMLSRQLQTALETPHVLFDVSLINEKVAEIFTQIFSMGEFYEWLAEVARVIDKMIGFYLKICSEDVTPTKLFVSTMVKQALIPEVIIDIEKPPMT